MDAHGKKGAPGVPYGLPFRLRLVHLRRWTSISTPHFRRQQRLRIHPCPAPPVPLSRSTALQLPLIQLRNASRRR